MTTQANWARLPDELKQLRQWCVAGPDNSGSLKAPYRATQSGLVNASPVNHEHWMDFNTACAWAAHQGWGIGFVLQASDPYTVIDIDVKNAVNYPNNPELWTTQPDLDRYWSMANVFDSYVEMSRSGQGLHIWVRGGIGAGCKRDGVELYSQQRFIVCTGNVLLDKPIAERQFLLEQMASRMRLPGSDKLDLEELDEEYTDDEVLERALNAGNAGKFNQLCAMTAGPDGTWSSEYPSQSEADLALMSIFTFYSKSNEQCRRLFRCTGLGKRDKATKDDRYLDNTLRLIRTRQQREQVVDQSTRALAESLVRELQAKQLQQAQQGVPAGQSTPIPQNDQKSLDWPPGFVGWLAQHVYSSSARPVKEVSIISALGLMAGVCGKAYLIPGSGLNLYIILVARSAIGKEAMHGGIGAILSEMRNQLPQIQQFVDFSDFVSGPSLVKACSANQSFVNVAGEWGRKLKRMASEDGRDAQMQQLRTVMTNLYQKSGPTSVVGGLTYSNKEQNIASVSGVAFSMIGETTPGTFYDALTETMMEDGFLSRFTIIEYDGERPPLNPYPVKQMVPQVKEQLHRVCFQALSLLGQHETCDVQFLPEAKAMLDAFDKECDAEINKTTDESWRQMWNRAHLKVLRIAALLAVGDNHIAPTVFPNHAQWALDLIRRDIALFMRRIDSGDVGTGDAARNRKLLALMREYMEQPVAPSYNIPDRMQKDAVIPRKLLQLRCARLSSFTTHRLGANAAMDLTLRSLCDSGYIVELDKTKSVTQYNYHGKCYRIISL